MRKTALLEGLQFRDNAPYSEPLFVNSQARALRFMLKPGQEIAKHNAPSSAFFAVVLKGTGSFTDGNGNTHPVGPMDFLAFDRAEEHSVRAGAEEFVFLGILQGLPQARPDHIGGTMSREDSQNP